MNCRILCVLSATRAIICLRRAPGWIVGSLDKGASGAPDFAQKDASLKSPAFVEDQSSNAISSRCRINSRATARPFVQVSITSSSSIVLQTHLTRTGRSSGCIISGVW